jgi:hypothetical protein
MMQRPRIQNNHRAPRDKLTLVHDVLARRVWSPQPQWVIRTLDLIMTRM